jgi:hypothetical protein
MFDSKRFGWVLAGVLLTLYFGLYRVLYKCVLSAMHECCLASANVTVGEQIPPFALSFKVDGLSEVWRPAGPQDPVLGVTLRVMGGSCWEDDSHAHFLLPHARSFAFS